MKNKEQTTKNHEGLLGRNKQPLLPHKGLHKVDEPWKNQGLPWPLIAVTSNLLRRQRREVSCTCKTIIQPAISFISKAKSYKQENMLYH